MQLFDHVSLDRKMNSINGETGEFFLLFEVEAGDGIFFKLNVSSIYRQLCPREATKTAPARIMSTFICFDGTATERVYAHHR